MKRLNLSGVRFGALLGLAFLRSEKDAAVWLFACDCGTFVQRVAKLVRYAHAQGRVVSCGCLAVEIKAENGRNNRTHGFSNTRLYDVHRQMLQRCYNEACQDFPAYGARGITVCEAWHDIGTFMEWCASSGYTEGLTIERQDVNGNYEPGNCTWVQNELQARNRRHHVLVTIDGVTKPVFDWLASAAVPRNTIIGRLSRGWSHKDAVTLPAGAKRPA